MTLSEHSVTMSAKAEYMRAALADHHQRGGDRDRGEDVEEDGVHQRLATGKRPGKRATPVAVTRIHTAATGMSTFQPKCISWS